jgi:hypothetical protein
MTQSFRATSVQTNKIIASGSTGTEAQILVYPITSEDSGDPNTGTINPTAFNTSSIGSDVFLYVSGAIDSLGQPTHGATVFGGDVHISGSVKVAKNFIISGSLSASSLSVNILTASLLTVNILSASIINSVSISGSLTSLSDGSPFLIAGPNINITTQSNGSIAISGTVASTFTSWVRVSDLASTGGSTISSKVYLDAGSNFLIRATTDKAPISVFVKSLYPSASLSSGSTVYSQLTADSDTDSYSGYINMTVSEVTSSITASVYSPYGILGESYHFDVLLSAAPEVTLVTFGTNGVTPAGYPGAQTEFQSTNTVSVYWTADKPVYTIQVQAGNGFASQTVSGIGGATSGTFTATTNYTGTTQQKSYITIRAANSAGAYGAYLSSWPTNPTGGTEGLQWMYANNLAPSFSFSNIVYPATQSALKSSETADIIVTVSDFDTISYTSPGSEVSIPSSTTYSSTKTVTRIGGTYNISTNNYQISATRSANAKTNTYQNVIFIANTTASCTVTEPATRLRSGGNDSTSEQSHIITATFNQQMSGTIHISGSHTPSVSNSQFALSGWNTAAWTGGTSVFNRTLKVHDNDTKGTYNWITGSSVYIGKNLAGISTTTFTSDATYTLGGFVARDVSFATFAQDANINVAVTDYSKVTAATWTASGNTAVKMTTQGDQTNLVEGYTIGASTGVGLSVNPANVHWNDSVRASTNADPLNLAKLLTLQETA